MKNNSLKTFFVKENPDGSLTIEWDENDPVFAHLNGMTEDEQGKYFIDAIEKGLKLLEQKEKANEPDNS